MAGGDPLELRIASLPDPRAIAVCTALRPVWRHRPAGGDGTGAGVAFQQYETTNAYVASYAEVTVDGRCSRKYYRQDDCRGDE